MDNEIRKALDNNKIGNGYSIYKDTGFSERNEDDCLKFVLVGITPGANQAPAKAKEEAKANGIEFGSIEYKFFKAFCGRSMRENIFRMLKHINEIIHPRKLDGLLEGVNNAEDLFKYEKGKTIIDYTSLIKDATYKYNQKTQDYVFFNNPRSINKKNEDLYNEFLNGFKKDSDEIYEKRKE